MLKPADIDLLKALYSFQRAATLTEVKKLVTVTKAQLTRLDEAGYIAMDITEGEDSSFLVTVSITKRGYAIINKRENLKKFLS